ncbi:MAG: hypothetical protein GY811_18695 [Myxococcales bacterium]|nr:hypothetical protein [Myxococcales bacterium]
MPDLENGPNAPDDLGEIEPWLEMQPLVQRVGASRYSLSAELLPEQETAFVFEQGL